MSMKFVKSNRSSSQPVMASG